MRKNTFGTEPGKATRHETFTPSEEMAEDRREAKNIEDEQKRVDAAAAKDQSKVDAKERLKVNLGWDDSDIADIKLMFGLE